MARKKKEVLEQKDEIADNIKENPQPMFCVELIDKYTHVKSFLAEGISPHKALYSSYGEAVKAAEDFLNLTKTSAVYSYLIRKAI